jgi:hypothetical protein
MVRASSRRCTAKHSSSFFADATTKGIKPRMFVREARALCPDLICLLCDYGKYEKVSQQIYQIFLKYSNRVQVLLYPSAGCAQSTNRSRGACGRQAVSADEAFLDLSAYSDPEDVIAKLRYIDCQPCC